MADIYEIMWAMGVPSSDMTDLSKVEPLRVSTVGERITIQVMVEEVFGLSKEGFADNPWGFPPIPYPRRRKNQNSEMSVGAPQEITYDALGHPIFWIDPVLTRRTDDEKEHPEKWAVRMFYLILGLNMFDPDTLQWFNVPRSQGINYTEQEWLAYRQGTSSVLDEVRLLTESDLVVPLRDVEEQTKIALTKCGEAQIKVWSQYRAELKSAYDTAVISQTNRSQWSDLEARMKETLTEVVSLVERGIVPTDKVKPVYAQIQELEDILVHTERCAIILTIPTLMEKSLGDRASSAATAINAANARPNISVDTLRALADELFSLDNNSKPSEFTKLFDNAVMMYMNSWKSLMVSARNLVVASEGGNLHQSWEMFELVEGDGSNLVWPDLADVMAGLGAR